MFVAFAWLLVVRFGVDQVAGRRGKRSNRRREGIEARTKITPGTKEAEMISTQAATLVGTPSVKFTHTRTHAGQWQTDSLHFSKGDIGQQHGRQRKDRKKKTPYATYAPCDPISQTTLVNRSNNLRRLSLQDSTFPQPAALLLTRYDNAHDAAACPWAGADGWFQDRYEGSPSLRGFHRKNERIK